MGVLDAILGAGVGIYQSHLDAKTQKRNVDMTNEANRELAEYAYGKDLEMWNRANEYGSPQAQMSRLKAAGLNPNLVYGSGSASGASAATLPKYQAPQQSYNYRSPVNLGPTIGLYQDVQMKAAQIENQKWMTENTKASMGIGPYAKSKSVQNAMDMSHMRNMDYAAQRGFSQRYGKEFISPGEFGYSSIGGYQQQYQTRMLQKMQAEIEKKDAETLFKTYENQWMRAGVTRSDNPLIRGVVRGWNAYVGESNENALYRNIREAYEEWRRKQK